MNNKLYSVGYNKTHNLCILSYDIVNKFYDNGWYYILNRETKDGYAICRISEHDMATMTFAFSPQCALMKFIMLQQNDIFEYWSESNSVMYYSDVIKENLVMIKKAKKELEKYL